MSRSVWNSSAWLFGQSSFDGISSSQGNVNLRLDLPDNVSLNQQYLIAGDHLIGNPFNGSTEETWHVRASSESAGNVIVARDEQGGFSAGTIDVQALRIGGHTVLDADGTVVSDSVVDRSGLRYLREFETIDPIDFGGNLTVHGKVQIGALDVLPEPDATEYGSERLYVEGNMVVTGDIMALSDARIKENVRTVSDGLERVRRLRGVTYTRKEDARQAPCVGLLAQEVQRVVPEVVHTTKDGVLGVSYGNLVAILIEAVKELDDAVRTCARTTSEKK